MAQGPMAMSEPNFGPLGDESTDDLPRTFRREKEARAREARERAAQERAAAPSLSTGPDVRPAHATQGLASQGHASQGLAPQVMAAADTLPAIEDMPYPSVIKRFDVPFFHLMRFFLKAVVAAIPALILLGVILWFLGAGLQLLYPDLMKMKILIGFQG